MSHLLNQLWPLRGGHDGRVVAVVFVVYLLAATAWWNLGLPAGFEAQGVTLLDMRAGWGEDDVRGLFAVLGEPGRRSYSLFLAWDVVYAAATALALGPLICWPLERIRPGSVAVRIPSLLPWLACALDLCENAAVQALLGGWPAVDGWLVLLGGSFTLVKLTLVGLLPVLLVSSWLGYGVVRLLEREPRRGS